MSPVRPPSGPDDFTRWLHDTAETYPDDTLHPYLHACVTAYDERQTEDFAEFLDQWLDGHPAHRERRADLAAAAATFWSVARLQLFILLTQEEGQ